MPAPVSHVALVYSPQDHHEHTISDLHSRNKVEKQTENVSATVFSGVTETAEHSYGSAAELTTSEESTDHSYLPSDYLKFDREVNNPPKILGDYKPLNKPPEKTESHHLYTETSPSFKVSQVHVPLSPAVIQKITGQFQRLYPSQTEQEAEALSQELTKAIQCWDDKRASFDVNQEDYAMISTAKGEFVVSPKGEMFADTGKAIAAGSFHEVKFIKSTDEGSTKQKAFRVDLAVRPAGTFIPSSTAEATIPYVGAGTEGIQKHIVRVWSTKEKMFRGTVTHAYKFGDLENTISKGLLADSVGAIGKPPKERAEALHKCCTEGFRQLLSGLTTTQKQGIAHNDIKPKNVLAERSEVDGKVKFALADWDEARFAHIPIMETEENINFSIVYKSDIKTIGAKSKEVMDLKTGVVNLEKEIADLKNDPAKADDLKEKEKILEENKAKLKKAEGELSLLGHKRDCMALGLVAWYLFTEGKSPDPLGELPLPKNYNPEKLLQTLSEHHLEKPIAELIVLMLNPNMSERPLPSDAHATLTQALQLAA